MATSEQIKALVKSYSERDDNRFYATIIQVADKEEKAGHLRVARELRALIDVRDKSKRLANGELTKFKKVRKVNASPAASLDLDSLLHLTHADTRLAELVLKESCRSHIERAILEYRQKERLEKYSLSPRRKLLLSGPPGTGKTMTARVLATELKLPLYTLQFDALISRYLGETAAKLRLVFDHISRSKAVYLFDEFDAIGANRNRDNDVGEIRRVLNSFLQFFEEESSESIIVCATNHADMLDKALFRRFDDLVEFSLPESKEAKEFISNRLFLFDLGGIDLNKVVSRAREMSYADLAQACDDAAKNAVLYDDGVLTESGLEKAVEYRGRQ